METTKLEAAIEKAAGELPEGWVINICVERDAGWVSLEDENGHEEGNGPVDSEESYADCVLRLIEEAKGPKQQSPA